MRMEGSTTFSHSQSLLITQSQLRNDSEIVPRVVHARDGFMKSEETMSIVKRSERKPRPTIPDSCEIKATEKRPATRPASKPRGRERGLRSASGSPSPVIGKSERYLRYDSEADQLRYVISVKPAFVQDQLISVDRVADQYHSVVCAAKLDGTNVCFVVCRDGWAPVEELKQEELRSGPAGGQIKYAFTSDAAHPALKELSRADRQRVVDQLIADFVGTFTLTFSTGASSPGPTKLSRSR